MGTIRYPGGSPLSPPVPGPPRRYNEPTSDPHPVATNLEAADDRAGRAGGGSSDFVRKAMPYAEILSYLAGVYGANPEAEVSGPELQHELRLDAATVESCVRELARDGLVEWDPLLTNTWLRITDKGMAAAARTK